MTTTAVTPASAKRGPGRPPGSRTKTERDPDSPWWDFPRGARYTGSSVIALRHEAKAGRLRAVRGSGRKWMTRRERLDTWLEARTAAWAAWGAR